MGSAPPGSNNKYQVRQQVSLMTDESEYLDVEQIEQESQSSEYIDHARIQSKITDIPANQIKDRLHKHTGVITFKCGNNPGKGTGFLISPSVLITCAHLVYNKKKGQLCSDFNFFPGQYGPLRKHYRAKPIYIPPQFPQSNNPFYDFAIMQIDPAVEEHDFIPLCPSGIDIVKPQNRTMEISLYGYPDSKYVLDSSGQSVKPWGRTGPSQDYILQMDKNKGELLHTLPTEFGHSGSPIIVKDAGGNLVIIAIHKGAVRKKKTNQIKNAAVLITQNIIQVFKREAKKVSLHELQVQQQLQLKPDNQLRALKQKLKETQAKLQSVQGQLNEASQQEQALKKESKILKGQAQKYKEESQILKCGLEQAMVKNKETQQQFEAYKKQKEQKICSLQEALQTLKEDHQKLQRINKSIIKKIEPIKLNQSRIGGTMPSAEAQAAALLERGNNFQLRNEHVEALVCYKRAIELNPSLWLAYYNLGVVLYDMGQKKEAVKYYRRAIQANPQAAEAYFNLAVALQGIKEHTSAIQNYRQAVALNPQDAHFHYGLGNAVPDTNEAIQCYRKAIQLKDTFSEAYFNLAEKYRGISRPYEAVDNYLKAIEHNPRDLEAYRQLYELRTNINRQTVVQIMNVLQKVEKKSKAVYPRECYKKFVKVLQNLG